MHPYLSLLLKPTLSHFRWFNIAGGMTGRPLFHRISCSWFPTLLAPIRSTRWLKLICNPICLTALHRPFSSALGSALLYLRWLLLSHSWQNSGVWLVAFQHFLHKECLQVKAHWSPTFHGICKTITWNIFRQKLQSLKSYYCSTVTTIGALR